MGMFTKSGNVYEKWECLRKVGMFTKSGNVYEKWECLLKSIDGPILETMNFELNSK